MVVIDGVFFHINHWQASTAFSPRASTPFFYPFTLQLLLLWLRLTDKTDSISFQSATLTLKKRFVSVLCVLTEFRPLRRSRTINKSAVYIYLRSSYGRGARSTFFLPLKHDVREI
jgi:hypothetical protein